MAEGIGVLVLASAMVGYLGVAACVSVCVHVKP